MVPQVAHPSALPIYSKYPSMYSTYDHRTLKIELPVRSAVLKQCTGGLVVRWVTTGEYPLLYVFVHFCFHVTMDARTDFLLTCSREGKGVCEEGHQGTERLGHVPTSYRSLFYGASHTPRPFPGPSITPARLRSTWTRRRVVHSLAQLGSTSFFLLIEWFSVKD
jgi:hypothetical protein